MGIPILTPEAVKDSKRAEFDSVQRRSIGLAEEENRIVTSLNFTRDAAEERKGEIALELQMFEAQAEDRKKVVLEEIAGLEKRRDLILPPIEAREKAAEKREGDVSGRESAATEREARVQVREDAVSAREKAVPEAEQAVKAREDAVRPREEELDLREEGVRNGYASLTGAQNALDEQKRVALEDIATKRAANDADAEANRIERERLVKQREEQRLKDLEIEDRYRTLAHAIEEFEKKKATP